MWLLILLIIVPMIEIALFIQVGGWLTLWPTLAIVVATAILGTWLLRLQGLRVLAELRQSLENLEDPSPALAHGAMILFAGALLLTPGFLTDAIGLALMVPQVRMALFNWARRNVKFHATVMGGEVHEGGQRRNPPHRPNHDIIEGVYEEAEPDPNRPPSGWTRH
jgi:UPF0716 protein FxsA